ncbi:hypothetical protein MTR_4g070130 [Medicago truncatula]|uniref:Uncharacterized protein n=1 Tax=Medicago truncatula TaxID=3880 RepID=G7JG72_MEDTR|nr:hypothetical protein MTR_4g070130 [Medicago truncatula]
MGNELVDETRKLKKELIIFKVDFEKGFNSVDCNYLDVVLLDLINKYVNVVCYRTFVIDACKPTAPTTIELFHSAQQSTHYLVGLLIALQLNKKEHETNSPGAPWDLEEKEDEITCGALPKDFF